MPRQRYLYNLFKEWLKFKCKQRGKKMVECNEAFASQTCTRYGTLKKTNLETYTCTNCHLEIDRDHTAVRSIYKYMHPYSIPSQGSESVSNHCNGDLALVSLWKFSIFKKSGLLMRRQRNSQESKVFA
eukprot:NODE_26_length_35450_cov_0.398320.p24 type:complete len:128 gc:universal NODE_26_length_35450_cov_0.398320:6244-5861(-)